MSSARVEPIAVGFELRLPKGDDSTVSDARVLTESFGYVSGDLAKRATTIECAFSFSGHGAPEEADILQLQPRLVDSRTKITYHDGEQLTASEISIARAKEHPHARATGLNLDGRSLSAPELESLEYAVLEPQRLRPGRRYRGLGTTTAAKCAGSILSHFFPLRLAVVFDAIDDEARRYIELLMSSWPEVRHLERQNFWRSQMDASIRKKLAEIIRTAFPPDTGRWASNRALAALDEVERHFTAENYLRFFHTLPPPLRHQVIARLAENESVLRDMIRAGRPPKYVLQFAPIPPETQYAVDYVKTYFHGKVKYLGPLRDEPKSVYPLSGATDPKEVGYRGEHTAAVLDLHKGTLVDYVTPDFLDSPQDSPPRRSAPLINAVMHWLNYMGVVQQVKTTDLGKLGHELRVATTDSPTMHDLTHVGVGVSQVLPILVLALLAETDSVLIFEQPELHLHPRVQTRLADFFVSLISAGKQCLVETHSEYLINRLRYLAAASEGKRICSDVTLYFVEKGDGQSRYSEVRINEYGAIPRWPRGFFDENEELSAAILRAAMEKRGKLGRK